MRKELNPELFSERSGKTRNSEASTSQPIPAGASAYGVANIPPLNVDHRLAEMRNQVQALTDQMNKMSSQVQDVVRAQQMKIEKMAQQIGRLELTHNGFAQEASQKLATVSSKIGERRTVDIKVQEMIDRHNSVLKTFEVRLNQIQKMLSEKEAQLLATTAALNDAKMEIARLKRL